jgi:poly(beta-D-mannuronate) lyase
MTNALTRQMVRVNRLAVWLMALLLLLCFSRFSNAAQYVVANVSDISTRMTAALPGDTLIMADGLWLDADILLRGNGAPGQPITLRAQTPGNVFLSGNSRLRMAGNYLVVDGLTFTNGYRSSGDVIAFRYSTSLLTEPANNSILTNCAVIDYNTPAVTNDTKWVSLFGVSNRVVNCYFKGKSNLGSTIVVWVEDQPNYHRIERNYFGFRPLLGVNGGETIRVGSSEVSTNSSHTIVALNYFDRCNGDVEVVSNKSGDNEYRHNTFVDCEGALSLRHGNGCFVEGNFFFGHNKPRTGGVRIIAEDHKVYNNYFSELAGSGSYSPLGIMQGLVNSPLNGYFQVKRAQVLFNTFVHCSNSIVIGLTGTLTGGTNVTTLPPVDCLIANNLVLSEGSKIIDKRIDPVNMLWQSNILFGGSLAGFTNGNFQVDPQLSLGSDGLWRPDGTSPARAAAGGTYSFVTADFEGQPRIGAKDIGCDQASVAPALYAPLSSVDVGPTWLPTHQTLLAWNTPGDMRYGTPLSSAQLNATANIAGTFTYNPPAGTILPLGANQILSVIFTPLDAASYSSATQAVVIRVIPGIPSITWTNPADITFGQALGLAQLNASVNVPGNFSYFPAIGTVLDPGNSQTLSVTFTPSDTVNYLATTQTVSINVRKVLPVVTWPTPAQISAGTPLGPTQLNAAADRQGTLIYVPPAGTILDPGFGQSLSVIFTPDDSTHYFTITQKTTINVLSPVKLDPVLSWGNPADITYGTPLSSAQLNAASGVAGTFAYSPPAGTVLNAGTGQVLTAAFTPSETFNYNSAAKSVTVNVRKANPTIAWAQPDAIVSGTPLGPVQLNATADVAGTFTYAPAAGTVLGAGNGQMLSVVFTPAAFTNYNSVTQALTIDVGTRTNLGLVRVAYLIPTNRVAQSNSLANLKSALLLYRDWLRDQMQRNGFGPKTFNLETEPDGITPKINLVRLAQTDSELLSDVDGSKIIQAATNAGVTIGARGQVWWLIPETHYEVSDGTVIGSAESSFSFGGSSEDPGWAMQGSDSLPFLRTDWLTGYWMTNDLAYNGLVVPELGPFPLQMGVSFPWFKGTTLSSISSYAHGMGLCSILAGLDLGRDFRNDENFNGSVMGFGFSGFRGSMFPKLFPFNAARLPYGMALALSVSPYFNPGRAVTDEVKPGVTIATSGPRTPQNGLMRIAFTASDAGGLHSALLYWKQGKNWNLVDEMVLSGTSGSFSFATAYYDADLTNEFQIRVYDRQGNRGTASTIILPAPGLNNAPLAFITVTPVNAGMGEDVVLDASGTFDAEHSTSLLEVEWDLDGDGNFDTAPSNSLLFTNRYYKLGANMVRARVSDPAGASAISAPIPVNITLCAATLSPVGRSHGFGLTTGTVTVGTSPRCTWNVIKTNDWITILGGPDFVGTNKIQYVLQANSSLVPRDATMMIADQIYSIHQDGIICTYSLSPTTRFHGFGAATSTVKVSAKDVCAWTIQNTNSWVTITSPLDGRGTGTVTIQYSVSTNKVAKTRSGNLLIGDQVYTVTQWGTNCAFVLSAASAAHSGNAETGAVTLSTSGNCLWDTVNTKSWIHIISGDTGFGSSNITYAVDANSGGLRSGTVLLGGEPFTVIQAACSYAIQPTTRSHSNLSETGSIALTAGGACPWTASTPNSWITVLSGPTNSGNGTIIYKVSANSTYADRTGVISAGGQAFAVLQQGIPCTYTISTNLVRHSEALEIGEIDVYAGAQCPWTVSNTNDWIEILFRTNGVGNGSATYSVDANLGLSRTGFVSVAGFLCRIEQDRGLRVFRATDMSLAGAQTNWVKLIYEAQGTGNSMASSLCYDPALLTYIGARLGSNLLGSTLAINTSQTSQGQVGLNLNLPSGWAFTESTQAVVEVGFRATMISGMATTTVAFCDSPVSRRILNVVGQPVPVNYSNATVTIVGDCSLAESLDAPQFIWTTNGTWFCQTNVTHDGMEAAQSAQIGDGLTTSFQTGINGPGTLSFWWKVSSETNNDTLRLFIAGTEQIRISGEVDWQKVTFSLPAGSNTVQWRYAKNGSVSVGQDRAWVDQVQFTPAAVNITTQPVGATLDQGNTVSLSVAATGSPPLSYQWLVNGNLISDGGNVSGTATASLRITNAQPSQSSVYSVLVGNPIGIVASSNALVTVGSIVPLAEALDKPDWIWTASGTPSWAGQSALSHDGQSSARSGAIADSGTTSIRVDNVVGPGTLTFWWKVSSETNNDRLRFYVNASEILRISGEVDWQFQTYNLGAGTNSLEWRYTKNSSLSAGQDHGWVDQVQFLPIAPAITTHPLSQAVDQGAGITLTVRASGSPPLNYRWQFNGVNLGDDAFVTGSGTATLKITNAQPSHAGSYSVLVWNASGTVSSSNATITVSPVLPLAEALDATNLNWTVTGTPPFVGQTSVTHDGVDAARSGAIPDGGTTSFQTAVYGPGVLSFWWKVSSEPSNDKLRFYINGSQQENITGEVDWTWRTYALSSGSNFIQWQYVKNSSISAGQDRGWVDQIIYISNSVPTAPIIALQPVSQSVVSPGTATFRVGAVGSAPLGYQWLFNGTNLLNGVGVSGATTTNLTLTSIQATQAGAYSVIVSNAAGTALSANAILTVITSPVITNQPASQNVLAGATVTFKVGAVGSGTLGYQWLMNGTNLVNGGKISGATTATLSISSAQAAQAGVYSVLVTNGAGQVSSSGASLVVSTAPSITQQPLTQTVVAGTNVSFMVTAAGSAPLLYQWRLNGTNLPDASASTSLLMLSNIQPAQAGVYSVLVSNMVGNVTSSNAFLTVITPPVITTQPLAQTIQETATASFNVSVSGSTPLTYQWRLNNTNLVDGGPVSGSSSSALTLLGAVPAQSGSYSVLVSNLAGIAISSNVVLKVIPALTLFDVLDGPGLAWATSAAAPWKAQTNVTHDGFDAAQSGNISANQNTWTETTVNGPGILRFWWKVSSETNHDFLTFAQDSQPMASLSGEVNWRLQVFEIQSGPHTFRWTYSKDSAGTNGQDRAWLDDVEFIPTFGPSQPAFTLQPLSQQVDAGSTATFAAAASGAGPMSYQWHFNGAILNDGDSVSGSKEPVLTVLGANPTRQGFYALVVQNDYGWAFSSNVALTLTPNFPLSEALDTTGRVWVAGGASAWIGQNSVTYDWLDAAQSGPLLNNQTNYIETTVLGPASVTFWWKVSSETNHDRIRFLVNGIEQANISGEVDWRWRSFDLTNFTQVLRWAYTKDATGSAGMDRGWLDQVIIGPAAPVIARQPVNTTADLGALAYFSVGDTGSKPINYQWYYNSLTIPESLTYGGTTLGTLRITNADPSQAGSYAVMVMNAGGRVLSTNASLGVYPNAPMSAALDTDSNTWSSGWITAGEAPWVTTTSVTHDGIDAMQSGSLLDGQRDWIETTVIGPGKLSFWWKVSSQTNAPGPTASGDKYRFFIGNLEQASISGEVDWQFKVFDVSNGVQILQWRYQKDGSLAAGADRAWLDQVQFAAVLGPVITNQPVGISMDPGATVNFTVGAAGSPPFSYQWRRNGTNLLNAGNVTGANTPALKLSSIQADQGGLYSVIVSNAAGAVASSNALLAVTPTLPLRDVLDSPDLSWLTSGSPFWLGQAVVSHDGISSARSGAIADGTSTAIQTTVNGPGTVTFWWKVSSETNKDVLIFYIGSTEKARISGELDWQQLSFPVPSGSQTLQWKYTKNGSLAVGQDHGWVDQVQFLPAAPILSSQPGDRTADAGTTVTLSASVVGTPPLTYQWFYNDAPLANAGNVSGATTPSLIITSAQTNQSGNYKLQVINSVGSVTTSNALLTVVPFFSLAEALDNPALVWATVGTPAWVGQPTVTHDGEDAARSGAIADGGTCTMQTTVNGPGTITFWWKVSSETNNDVLRFLVGGTELARISGEVDWNQRSFSISSSGTSTLAWTYKKNGSLSAGQDKGWVDQVQFLPTPPTFSSQPTNRTVEAGTSVTLSASVLGTPPLNFQWFYNGAPMTNGGNVSGAATTALTISSAQINQSGSYGLQVANSIGSITSSTALLTVTPVVPLADALDAPNLIWTVTGTPPFVGQTAVTHDGVDAARSGAIPDGGTTAFQTSLRGPGVLTFWWKVSSELGSDKLRFYINGSQQENISGEIDWTNRSYILPTGSNFVQWQYTKNSSGSAGQDRGWVDQVQFSTNAAAPIDGNPDVSGPSTSTIAANITYIGNLVSISWDANPQKVYQLFYKDNIADPDWQMVDGEVRIRWKLLDEQTIDPNSVIATMDDVLGSQSRYYRIVEY